MLRIMRLLRVYCNRKLYSRWWSVAARDRTVSKDYSMSARMRYFLMLMTVHTALLIASTVAGSKLFALPFGLTASATVFSYLLALIILDTVAELYGKEYARLVINLGLMGMAVSAVYLQFTIVLPPAPDWHYQQYFKEMVLSSWRIWIGGWIAYLISQHLDVWSFISLREATYGRRSVVFRAWISLLLSQLLDTVVFISIAFYGTIPIGPAIAGQYVLKVAFSTVAVPLVKLTIMWGRRLLASHDAGDGEV
jgi:queuosine precursor transporter